MAVMLLGVAGCDTLAARRAAIEKAQAQTQRIASELDQRTTATGVYVRPKDGEIQEDDPWGTRIKISYSQGGIAEMIDIRSAGPDHEFHTDDDIVAHAMAANLKGVGEGIKKHAGETAANAAKGLVRGTVEGVKESIKESWPLNKKKDGAAQTVQKESDGDAASKE